MNMFVENPEVVAGGAGLMLLVIMFRIVKAKLQRLKVKNFEATWYEYEISVTRDKKEMAELPKEGSQQRQINQ